jgi:hypothetical protein
MESYRQYMDELEHNWQDDLYMGCCVVRKEDQAEKPIAMVIASASVYRADVRRLTDLNWRRTNAYREKEEQWCLEYLVRARECRGSGVGCFALVGLLECFCSRFHDGVLWLLLAGGFCNTNALSLYTDVGFLVTSLDSDKTPIMLLQVQDIGQRACRKLVDTLTHGAAAAEQGGGDGGDGGGDEYARRLRRRVRRRGGVQQPARRGVLENMENLTFRTIEDHLTLLNGQLVLPLQAGLENDMMRHLWSMSDRAVLNPSVQSFLIHLNVAKQYHHIASQRWLHVSRWIAEQRQENRENQEWNRRFAVSLANDVLLL